MKIAYWMLAIALLLGACNKSRKAPNGLEIDVIREGDGKLGKSGDFIVMNLLYKDAKDSIYNDTRKQNIPVVIGIRDSTLIPTEKGIESCFRVLKKGDSVRVNISAKSFYEDSYQQPLPAGMDPASNLTFLIGVVDITDRAGVAALQEKIQAREYEKYRKLQEGQLTNDTTAIDLYLSNNKIAAVKDKSGLRYVITRQGNGPKPALSNVVKVNYKGSLLSDGKVFDQSQSPVEFQLAQLIQGWQIGFQLLPKGTKATLYVPSVLGYGANGAPPEIPANANLIFEVELIDFK